MTLAGLVLPWWSRWAAILALVLAIAAVGFWQGDAHRGKLDEAKAAKIQALADKERLAQYQAYTKALQAHIATEADLRQKAEAADGELNAKVADIRARADAMVAQLRKRPSRTASNGVPAAPSAACPAQLCTGAGLAGQDAEFLIRESSAAAEIGSQLADCIARYNGAKASLEVRH